MAALKPTPSGHKFTRRKGRRVLRICLSLVALVLVFYYLAIGHVFMQQGDFTETTVSSIISSQAQLLASEIDESIAQHELAPRFTINTVVLPSVVNPKGRKQRLDSITATWATQTNAIYVTHPGTDSDYSILSASSQYPKLMPIPHDVATEEQGVPRLQYVIKHTFNEYNPDFAFFVNDHTFVIPEHLNKYLNAINAKPNEQLYAGHALRPRNQKGTRYAFNSGASGYFLSRKTMQALIEKWNDGDAVCAGSGSVWLQGNPGLLTAECLKSMGVDPVDSRDKDKRHIFHAFGLVRVVKNEVDDWYHKMHEDLDAILGDDNKYHHKLQKGEMCCSSDTVSFHYVEYAETRALWATLQMVRSNPDVDDEMLQQYMITHFPQDKKDIGAYAYHLPAVEESDTWFDLLKVVRNIASF